MTAKEKILDIVNPKVSTDEIKASLEPIENRQGDNLKVFIPKRLAAICADCGGTFVSVVGVCPGCGSSQFYSHEENGIQLPERIDG